MANFLYHYISTQNPTYPFISQKQLLSYNYIIHPAPINGDGEVEYYHWHIEFMPKLTQVAGFEWGTGFYLDPTSPELAAGYLKAIKE